MQQLNDNNDDKKSVKAIMTVKQNTEIKKFNYEQLIDMKAKLKKKSNKQRFSQWNKLTKNGSFEL